MKKLLLVSIWLQKATYLLALVTVRIGQPPTKRIAITQGNSAMGGGVFCGHVPDTHDWNEDVCQSLRTKAPPPGEPK
ncbi:hypothetical protein GCM10009854_40150 [Saccharopolyspora halophila]|uniref:Secreted protein n=1 Tax=Saccharopolyspora halophila TaxID=405551 RepID=A0ABN3GPT2_9PSEU